MDQAETNTGKLAEAENAGEKQEEGERRSKEGARDTKASQSSDEWRVKKRERYEYRE